MAEQKVVITDSADSINFYLNNGWRLISVTAQHVSVATIVSYFKEFVIFCFVIEKTS